MTEEGSVHALVTREFARCADSGVCSFHLRQIWNSGAKLVAEALASPKGQSLQRLYLGNNGIGLEGMKALAKALESHQHIVYLDLAWNSFDGEAIQVLGTALVKNSSLKSVKLSYNIFQDKGAEALSRVFARSSVEHWKLHGNSIGDKGIQAFAYALMADGAEAIRHPMRLDLRRNSFGDAGATALAVALQNSNVLEHLDIRDNMVGDAGIQGIAAALKYNASLKVFLSSHDRRDIEDYLARNRRIPNSVRATVLYVVGVRFSHRAREGMGDLGILARDIVRIIGEMLWATRNEACWIRTVSSE